MVKSLFHFSPHNPAQVITSGPTFISHKYFTLRNISRARIVSISHKSSRKGLLDFQPEVACCCCNFWCSVIIWEGLEFILNALSSTHYCDYTSLRVLRAAWAYVCVCVCVCVWNCLCVFMCYPVYTASSSRIMQLLFKFKNSSEKKSSCISVSNTFFVFFLQTKAVSLSLLKGCNLH